MAFDLWSSSAPAKRSIWRRLSPPQLLAGSFLLLIAVGTLGLKWLPGMYTGEPLSWLNAMFTATSAVCVTGLIVVDTATYFTTAGQTFILVLIQFGGLGIITFTTVIIVALGRRLSLRHEVLASDMADIAPHVDYRHLVRNVFLFSLAFELLGALLLYAFWGAEFGWTEAIWPSVFHSISAFCNAGFSVFSDSLSSFREAPGVQFTIMVLIIFGGIGFLTLEELYLFRKARSEKTRFRLSLHSRLVLAATGTLLLLGWIIVTLAEWSGAFAGLPTWAKLVNGLFASVTARTAGFNTIDYAATTETTNFLTIFLMFVGGSPGSTAGGIKTTTFALIGLIAWSRLRGHRVSMLWGRSVPEETVQRAVGLVVAAFVLISAAIFVFTVSELSFADETADPFLAYMFEAASAFNTVGLSMGVTGELSTVGRWTTMILMFLGRVGPATFASALAMNLQKSGKGLRFAYEDVAIG